MKLEDGYYLPIGSVKEEEILFISDLETFDKETSNKLLSIVKKENKKLIVFIGDILSGINDQIFPIVAYERSYEAMKFVFDRDIDFHFVDGVNPGGISPSGFMMSMGKGSAHSIFSKRLP